MDNDIRREFYLSDIPTSPGVYIYRDKFNKIIYVGKASNLRRRMAFYFRRSSSKVENIKLRSLINSIASWEYITVKSETEALILEANLIKKYAPYYNTLLRDDKRFLLIKLDLKQEYPTIRLVRIKKSDGAKYYGPFPHGKGVKKLADFLIDYFKLRPCKFYNPGLKERKHCLNAHIKKCSQVCIGKISKEEYWERVRELIKALDGDVDDIIAQLIERMRDYANRYKFEQAAEIRDIIENLKTVIKNRPRRFKNVTLANRDVKEGLEELKDIVAIENIPTHIEAIDISNFSSHFAVASLVCFIDGKPNKRHYKQFKIKGVEGINDFAMVKEVVKRHFSRILKENRKIPDLLIIDGGKGQLSSALEGLSEISAPYLPVIGLAKKNEEIFLPGEREPIILARYKSSLQLLQSIRDEAHRFAINYNKKIRLKRIEESILDDIPQIGPQRKKALLKTFGSVKNISKATPEEICKKINSIGKKLAEEIITYLNSGKNIKSRDPYKNQPFKDDS